MCAYEARNTYSSILVHKYTLHIQMCFAKNKTRKAAAAEAAKKTSENNKNAKTTSTEKKEKC